MGQVLNPSLYQVNARVWVRELATDLGRPATLDDVPDLALDRLAGQGIDWLWLMGVWQTGEAGRRIARTHPGLQPVYRELLPGFAEEDVCGSPFAIVRYQLDARLGGPATLVRLRERLRRRGLRLMLDFVPNHTALDHAWARRRPGLFIHGRPEDAAAAPHNYWSRKRRAGPLVLAHGRDPYFPGWTDTLQLNYRHPAVRRAMRRTLKRIAGLCDGVRCDMAMLLLPDVFQRTWGDASLPADGTPPDDAPFWPEAIARVRRDYPDFVFLAEVYWDLEKTLLEQGFTYTYDKGLYDRLRDRDARAVRDRLRDGTLVERSAHFLENHDEPRAAATFPRDVHRAAAVLTFLLPGLRFFHDGQREGRRVKPCVQLVRRAAETPDAALVAFYDRLLACVRRPEARAGRWQLLDCRPAWEGNPTWEQFVAYVWQAEGNGKLLTVANYGATQGQCYLCFPHAVISGGTITFRDLMGEARYDRSADELRAKGLYLDLPAWGYHVFDF